MNFLSPTAFLLFGLAAPIVMLYILRLRRRREPVSTLMFWEQIFREKQTTSLFQKLKHLLSLLLQLLFLALLVPRACPTAVRLHDQIGATGYPDSGSFSEHECR